MKPLRILHICDWYKPIGGAEKLLFDTLGLLEANGYSNIVAFNDYGGQHITGTRPEYPLWMLEVNHYDVTLIESFGLFLLNLRIDRIIRKEKPDVCHIHNCQNPFLIEHLIRRLPCVRSLHDPRLYCFTQWRLLPDKSICPHPLGAACLKNGCLTNGKEPVTYHDHIASRVYRHYLAHRKMPVLIVESSEQGKCVLQNGYAPEQVELLPNFTPIRPEPEARERRARYYRADEKIVLFVGRASYEKGAHILIEAAAKVKSGCKIILITAGPLLDEYRNQVASKGLAGKVEVIGGLSYEDTAVYYARAHVIVVPSVWIENFCLVGLEAFANMTPVIGSRIGGIMDWLTEGETGYFFKMGDSDDLAGKIDLMMSDPERAERMGEAAYRRVCEHYNKTLYLEKLTKIYEKGISRWQATKRPL